MVAGSTAYYHDTAACTSMTNKCRYKTGKCTNARSSKRNGQPHMLCLFHRDKANKIQRKFDRQKRQSVRMKKSSSTGDSVRAMGGAAAAFANAMAMSSSTSLATAASSSFADVYSDSDSSRLSTDSESSRFSTDSDASNAASLEMAWQSLPSAAMITSFAELLVAPTSLTMAAQNCGTSMGGRFHNGAVNAGSLSHEEIDFLYSAMLE